MGAKRLLTEINANNKDCRVFKALQNIKLTFLRVVCSKRHKTFLVFSTSLAAAPVKNTVNEGAFGFLLVLIISCRKDTIITNKINI